MRQRLKRFWRSVWALLNAAYKVHVFYDIIVLVLPAIAAVVVAVVTLPSLPTVLGPGPATTVLGLIFAITYVAGWVLAVLFILKFHRARTVARQKSSSYDHLLSEHELQKKAVLDKSCVISRFEKFEASFDSFSFHNAQHEKDFFDCICRPRDRECLNQALQITTENLRHLATTAAELLRILVDKPCATSIKVVFFSDGTYRTLMRDRSSQPRRGSHEVTYGIRENTAFLQLFRGKHIYAKERLRELRDNNKYINGRGGWEKDYNATIVVPIGTLRSDPTEIGIRGAFCADYEGAEEVGGKLQEPNFESEICQNLLRGMSYRVSVLLYRADRLEQERELIPRRSTKG